MWWKQARGSSDPLHGRLVPPGACAESRGLHLDSLRDGDWYRRSWSLNGIIRALSLAPSTRVTPAGGPGRGSSPERHRAGA